jgi:hypothetical protein
MPPLVPPDELEATRLKCGRRGPGVFPLDSRRRRTGRRAGAHELIEIPIVTEREHEPDVTGTFDLFDEILEGRCADCAVADGLLDRARAAIESDHLVTAEHESMDHVAAHSAQANEAKLHEHYDTPSPGRPWKTSHA